jgi:hypothetical protein
MALVGPISPQNGVTPVNGPQINTGLDERPFGPVCSLEKFNDFNGGLLSPGGRAAEP